MSEKCEWVGGEMRPCAALEAEAVEAADAAEARVEPGELSSRNGLRSYMQTRAGARAGAYQREIESAWRSGGCPHCTAEGRARRAADQETLRWEASAPTKQV